jgi:hypothetical protein
MSWHPDVPNIPIKKPKEIETLELMDRVSLDSMPPMEVQEKVDEIAHSVARDYKKQVKNGTFEGCLEIVSVALRVTGSAIGGNVGNAMIAECDTAALNACRIAFPE